MMKKFFSLLLILALCICVLASCSNGGKEKSTGKNEAPVTEAEGTADNKPSESNRADVTEPVESDDIVDEWDTDDDSSIPGGSETGKTDVETDPTDETESDNETEKPAQTEKPTETQNPGEIGTAYDDNQGEWDVE